MCDTLVTVHADRVLFAKNSDRDLDEALFLGWQPRREHPPGSHVKRTWISVRQARRTHAVLLSRPIWLWGAEIGAKEHGVVIGDGAVFTRQPRAVAGLTAMDLVRLGLERTATAAEAVELIAALLASHGQGGGAVTRIAASRTTTASSQRTRLVHSSLRRRDGAGRPSGCSARGPSQTA